MSKLNISADNLGKEIANTIAAYTKEVEKGIKQASKEVADEAVKELRATSPRSKKKGRHYADGWTKKKKGDGYIIHNKSKPGLAHLLEFGHLKRGGKDRVSGVPHITPAEDKAIKKFERIVEKIIKNGGK